MWERFTWGVIALTAFYLGRGMREAPIVQRCPLDELIGRVEDNNAELSNLIGDVERLIKKGESQ
ncbi:MAG: hypothetical protein ACRDCE_22795 [Cetobacterium sp.]|uniref:hypothetical protein n=1 Tax=Cetobacterium sp. TaxID=2071632 RepID=UPI003EE644BE